MSVDPNLFFDKIYIINLVTESERWRAITQELTKHRIWNYQRFNAICPDYPQIDKRHYSQLKAYKGKFRNDKRYIVGSIGCKMSHHHIWRLALRQGYSRILVLEDDVSFSQQFTERFSRCIGKLLRIDTDWELLYLGGNLRSAKRRGNGIYRINKCNSSYAIAYQGKALEKLIKNPYMNGQEIDVYLRRSIHPNLRCYFLRPPLIGHLAGKSSITNQYNKFQGKEIDHPLQQRQST